MQTLLQILREEKEVKLRLDSSQLSENRPAVEVWTSKGIVRLPTEDLVFSTGGSVTLMHGQQSQ